jgi:hypothetical protein
MVKRWGQPQLTAVSKCPPVLMVPIVSFRQA